MLSCVELQDDVMCPAIALCPCGLCQDEIVRFLDCAFRQLVGCALECDFSN